MTELHLGNNLDILPTLAENSFDSCVTDPPYGLSFMGNKWDYDVPTVKQWQAVMRVMKPGAYLLAFGGARTYHRMAVRVEDAGFELRDQIMWLYGSGFPKNANTQLKPAHEPIIMAQKPFLGSAKANVERWGTGYLNVDVCRVPAPEGLTPCGCMRTRSPMFMSAAAGVHHETGNRDGHPEGRWPANVIHDGSEVIMNEFASYGERGAICPTKNRGNEKLPEQSTDLLITPRTGTHVYNYGRGSAARFFYAAKASPADREPFNTHPTVKPTSLMRYLCKLVTPVGGIIIDPWTGSGSTGKGAVLDGFSFVGIDEIEHNISIAKRRIDGVRDLFTT